MDKEVWRAALGDPAALGDLDPMDPSKRKPDIGETFWLRRRGAKLCCCAACVVGVRKAR